MIPAFKEILYSKWVRGLRINSPMKIIEMQHENKQLVDKDDDGGGGDDYLAGISPLSGVMTIECAGQVNSNLQNMRNNVVLAVSFVTNKSRNLKVHLVHMYLTINS